MKEIPPFPGRITALKVENRTLKREARASFHSEAGRAGLLSDHGEKLHSCESGCFSTRQINPLVRELCLCKQDALDLLFRHLLILILVF